MCQTANASLEPILLQVVFFTSDNGPYAEAVGSCSASAGRLDAVQGWSNAGRTGGLRGSKAQTWEGGIRCAPAGDGGAWLTRRSVPGIVRWPGKVPAGVITDQPANTMDMCMHDYQGAG